MTKTKRIFFATDIHGSDRCFRKFINCGKFYGVDTLILGGDVTGKMLVPLIKQSDGSYHGFFIGTEHVIKPRDLENTEKMLRDSGAYVFRATKEEHEELSTDEKKRLTLFKEFMFKRLNEWLVIAEERLRGTGIQVYITGGNDDFFEVEDILASSSYAIGAEGKVLETNDGYEILSSGYSNETPWHCPRDVADEVIGEKIGAMISRVKNMNKCIFNLHAPPLNTPLDQAPLLDKTLTPVLSPTGGYEMVSVGSKSVRNAIEKYQPLLGLHGHIHESRASMKIGKTICLNPGSEYGEGILRGSIITLSDKKGVESTVFTSG